MEIYFFNPISNPQNSHILENRVIFLCLKNKSKRAKLYPFVQGSIFIDPILCGRVWKLREGLSRIVQIRVRGSLAVIDSVDHDLVLQTVERTLCFRILNKRICSTSRYFQGGAIRNVATRIDIIAACAMCATRRRLSTQQPRPAP